MKKKLNLDTDDLRVESFATAADGAARRGTVRALDGSVGYSASEGARICACDTTYTQRAPECDPSAETFCFAVETAHPCACA